MKSHTIKILILSLTLAITGCTSIGKSVGSIQAGYDEARSEGRMEREMKYAQEYSDMVMANSKEICETTNSDKSETTRQAAIDACIDYVYTSVMANAKEDNSSSSGNNNNSSVQSVSPKSSSNPGQKVYRADECVGAVVNGVCHGSIIPKGGYTPTCYGTMLNGQCTGSMF